jgi:hypothetical protein
MVVSVYPPSAGGGIKSVQRGQAVSSGSITITSVNTSKAFVSTFSEGAAGTVAVSGSVTGTLSPSGGSISGTGQTGGASQYSRNAGGSFASYTGTRTFSGGTMDATTKEMGGYLSNSTTLVVTGACRWQVVEFL